MLDPRLKQRGVDIIRFPAKSGESYWKLVEGRWMDEVESRGHHSVFLDAVDREGNRMVGVEILFVWPTGSTTKVIEEKRGEEWGQAIPMYEAGNSYSVSLKGRSDVVKGLGLGTLERPNEKRHTSFGFRFQWAVEGEGEPEPAGEELWAQVKALAEEILRLIREAKHG